MNFTGVVYAYAIHKHQVHAHTLLQTGVTKFLHSIIEEPPVTALWSMHYDQKYGPPPPTDDYANVKYEDLSNDHILRLPDLQPGLALEDDVLRHVQAVYNRIVGEEGAAFMVFEDKEGTGDEDNDN